MTQHSEPAPADKTEGRFARLIKEWVLDPVTVEQVAPVADGFRLLDLSIDPSKASQWTPGDKVQIAIGSGLAARTYTPFNLDRATGRFQILAYLHDNAGPGCDWLRNAKPGEQYRLLGPRKSLKAPTSEGTLLLIGDETCFGLAAALTHQSQLRCLFEVGQVANSEKVLDLLGVQSSVLVQREPGDNHWQRMQKEILKLDQHSGHFILAGKASSIQRARSWLKIHGVSNQRMHAKAYWAPGKKGLD
ncbi:siderophore-interacting protein [Saccharospirillum sp. HFRX-1]|uniref:siderophore-interacting protein n=1 Tax=unclassified Saccharospirillum TaxID=2633430 RepID=UPI00371B0E29